MARSIHPNRKQLSGEPQNSILGPLLYLYYINYLPEYTDRRKYVSRVDDMNLIIPDTFK